MKGNNHPMTPSVDNDKVGRPGGKSGMTKGASLSSGLSEHSQIKAGNASMGMDHAQGERPKAAPATKMSHGGKSFITKH